MERWSADDEQYWGERPVLVVVRDVGGVAIVADTVTDELNQSPYTRDTTAEAEARQQAWLAAHPEASVLNDAMAAVSVYQRQQAYEGAAADNARAVALANGLSVDEADEAAIAAAHRVADDMLGRATDQTEHARAA